MDPQHEPSPRRILGRKIHLKPRKTNLLFIIPARGGSKGIPGKNLVLLAGLPLLAHVIRAAQEAMERLSHVSSRLIVSTEDPRIAETARRWGAGVPFPRPRRLAGDRSPTLDAVRHALKKLADTEGYRPDAVVLLQPTSPLVDPSDIAGAIHLFLRHGHPVVSVTQNEHPMEKSFRLVNQVLHPLVRGRQITLRQDAVPTYRLNGAVWIGRAGLLLGGRGFITPRTLGFIMPAERSVDIDTSMDLQIAEALLSHDESHADSSCMRVESRLIGPGKPCFILARAGADGDGNVTMAERLIDAAAEAGANAISFQPFRADEPALSKPLEVQGGDPGIRRNGSRPETTRRRKIPPEGFRRLIRRARDRGIFFIPCPLDESSADFLETLDVPAFKIQSEKLADESFLEHVARKGRPMILSFDRATLREAAQAMDIIRRSGNPPLALLRHPKADPTHAQEADLRIMRTLERAFHRPVGYSDQTEGRDISIAAVAMGAKLLEKPIILNRRRSGSDRSAGIDPREFFRLVQAVRHVEKALDGDKTSHEVAARASVNRRRK